jgi:hypothetical protein
MISRVTVMAVPFLPDLKFLRVFKGAFDGLVVAVRQFRAANCAGPVPLRAVLVLEQPLCVTAHFVLVPDRTGTVPAE